MKNKIYQSARLLLFNKIMNSKYLFFLFAHIIVLLSPFNGAQLTETEARELLQKIDKSLNDIHTVVYKIDYTNKFLSRRDTIHTTAICSLYIAPRDKMKAYSIMDLVFTELNMDTYGHRQYDGKRALWINCPADSLDMDIKPDICKDRQKRHAVVQNYSNLLLSEYLMQKKPFGKYKSVAGNIGITEETLNNVPVYVLTIAFKDHEDVRDNVNKHYIRKSDYLPVAYYSFLRWENMEQYNYYEVEYLAINPDIPLEKFKIDENETINATERYKMLKEKINN